jgi:hypothetical protein
MLATLLILSTTAGVDGFVVCTDDDGPTGTDRRSCSCCSDAVSHDEGEHSEQSPASSSCTECIDVPMSVPSVESRVPCFSASHTISEATIVSPESASGRSAGLSVAENRSDQHWRLLALLASVVLLT